MSVPKIQIKTDGCKASVLLDGKDISSGITEINFSLDASHIPTINFKFLATNMEIDTELVPELPECLEPFYKLKTEDDN